MRQATSDHRARRECLAAPEMAKKWVDGGVWEGQAPAGIEGLALRSRDCQTPLRVKCLCGRLIGASEAESRRRGM